MVTQRVRPDRWCRSLCVYVRARIFVLPAESPHVYVWFLTGWLEAEYLFGIDCTPVSLRFFQEFEPYDPWHWSLSCSDESSAEGCAADFEGRLDLRRDRHRRKGQWERANARARRFLLDTIRLSSYKGILRGEGKEELIKIGCICFSFCYVRHCNTERAIGQIWYLDLWERERKREANPFLPFIRQPPFCCHYRFTIFIFLRLAYVFFFAISHFYLLRNKNFYEKTSFLSRALIQTLYKCKKVCTRADSANRNVFHCLRIRTTAPLVTRETLLEETVDRW